MKNRIALLSIFFIAFLLLYVGIVGNSALINSFDQSLAVFAESIRNNFYDGIFIFATNIGYVFGSILIFLVLAFVLIKKREKISSVILISSSFLGMVLAATGKYSAERIRPSGYLINETGFSFPSYHATMATIFLLSSLLLVAPLIQNKFLKISFIIIAIILFPLIAFSRIYLSVHYASDVLGGIFIGIISYLLAKVFAEKISLHNA